MSSRSLNKCSFSSTRKFVFFLIVLIAVTLNRQLKNICVLSESHYGKYKEFIQATIDFGHAMVKRELHLVFRGGDRELSKLIL